MPVSRFAHDIFISYAHIDDEEDTAGRKWVSTLVRDLELALKQRVGLPDDVDVYKDSHSLEAGEQLKELLRRAEQSAVFLAILSPSYVKRDWTRKEFETFRSVAGRARPIFVVDKLPPATRDIPPPMREIKWAIFHEPDDETKVPMTIGREHRLYAKRVDTLATHIGNRLLEVRPPHVVEPPPRAIVLLGRVTDALLDQWGEVRNALIQDKIAVVPNEDYAEEGAQFKQRFLADLASLKKAPISLFVQLIGQHGSRKTAEFPTGHERFQVDAAASEGVRVLTWRAGNIDLQTISSEDQLALLKNAVAMTVPQLHTEIMRQLAPPKPIEPVREDLVFVNSAKSDLDLAHQLGDALRESHFGVSLPVFGRKMQKDLEDNIRVCDSLVFVFGNAEPDWLRAQMLQYRKLKPERRSPPRVVRIFNAPPLPKGDPEISLPEARAVSTIGALVSDLRA